MLWIKNNFLVLGRDDWKMLAEGLGLTPGEILFFDQRTLNPFQDALAYIARQRFVSVGELYDSLNEHGCPIFADFL